MEQLGLDVTDLLMPWISVLISLLVAIWMKDYATSLAKGLKFKMNPAFNEGDEVLLDGELVQEKQYLVYILKEDILGDMFQMKEFLI